ncbi:MAG: acyltransferase [Paludibacter sp.]|nr:acyltransferase [Paludibacter sp.]
MIWILDNSKFVTGENCTITNSYIVLKGNAKLILESNIQIENCNLTIVNSYIYINKDSVFKHVNFECLEKSNVEIGNMVEISNYNLILRKAVLKIADNNFFSMGRSSLTPNLSIQEGSLNIGNHNFFRCDFLLRYNGICEIGTYNGICENTEIRCDELITIGSFNMISYQCMIYDTNTHNIYDKEFRRELTRSDFPNIGRDLDKPKTKPVYIGNDCWMGKRAVVLKGTIIYDECIIGTNALISNVIVPPNSIVVGNPAIIK